MALPPSFLDGLRARVALVDVVRRKVKLTKRGREHSGLCPFHSEKSPSFTVNEDKGFFHCFGCGAHGDVLGFVMRAENLGFMEAVERLAAEAGLEVPRTAPQDRVEQERDKTLHAVLEAACVFFQNQLRTSAGMEARNYLERRSLDAAAIERFRLGVAPAGSTLLKQHLLREFPAILIEQAGLVRTPEDGRDSYDYFRNRVMFPILDRRGHVIAFGGRVLDDSKPKYLNSPESPVFQKGHILYGMSWARDGVGRGTEAVVTEGYMDVIALHRAGFAGAVAPLGTALTEAQLAELWKIAAEPILCFDGDAAGTRAMARALERALPLLTPGHSLRFATLPAGEDPDTMIAKFGAAAMRGVLETAKPLVEVLWSLELSEGPVDTPERRADFSRRLQNRAGLIAQEDLQREYRRHFRDLVYQRLGSAAYAKKERGKSGRPALAMPALPSAAVLERRRQEVLLRILLDHPELLDEAIEDLATLELSAPDLERLRHAIIDTHARVFPLDAALLNHHLSSAGVDPAGMGLYGRELSDHVRFGKSTSDPDLARRGWQEALSLWRQQRERPGEVAMAVRRFDERPGEETNTLVKSIPVRVDQERRDLGAFEEDAVVPGPGISTRAELGQVELPGQVSLL